MSGDPYRESSPNLAGSFQIEGPDIGDDLSYWVSKGLGYTLLGGGLLLALSSPFIL